MLDQLPDNKDKLKILVLGLSPDEIHVVQAELAKARKDAQYKEIFDHCLNSTTLEKSNELSISGKKLRNAKHHLTKRIVQILSQIEGNNPFIHEDRLKEAAFLLKKGNFRKSYIIAIDVLNKICDSENFEFGDHASEIAIEAWRNLDQPEYANKKIEVSSLHGLLAQKQMEFKEEQSFYNFKVSSLMRGVSTDGKIDSKRFQELIEEIHSRPVPQFSWKARAIYYYSLGNSLMFVKEFTLAQEKFGIVISILEHKPSLSPFLASTLLNTNFRLVLFALAKGSANEAIEKIDGLRLKAQNGQFESIWRYVICLLSIAEQTQNPKFFIEARGLFWANVDQFNRRLRRSEFGNLVYHLLKVSVLFRNSERLSELFEILKSAKPNLGITIYSRLIEIFLSWQNKEVEEVERLSENLLKYIRSKDKDTSYPIALKLAKFFKKVSRLQNGEDLQKIKSQEKKIIFKSPIPGTIESNYFDFEQAWESI